MDFTKLRDYMESLEETYDIPGAAVKVYHNHENVFTYTVGYRDHAKTEKVREDDYYVLFSMSKPITCTAAMRLVEEGKLSLDDKVSKYLPEYENMMIDVDGELKESKTPMTIKHLFTMTSGLSYSTGSASIKKIVAQTDGEASTREVVRAIANEPLLFEPGEHFKYSLSHDVLGAVIEVVSGMKFGDYLKKYIFEPLGIKDITFDIESVDPSRFTASYRYDGENRKSSFDSGRNEYRISKKHQSGGAGLAGTIGDYAIFASAMASGGVSEDGYKLLSREMIDLMRKPHISGDVQDDFRRMMNKKGYGYGLGVRTMIDKTAGLTSRSPIGEFGWDGAAGSYVVIDVENGISIVYCQQVRKCEISYQEIHPTIRNLVYECMGL